MRVLLAQPNLLHGIGGGETVYRKIISNNPEIDFYILVDKKNVINTLPENCHEILIASKRKIKKAKQSPRFRIKKMRPRDTEILRSNFGALEQAERIARSLRGFSFDFVDVPEYYIVGPFLRSELLKKEINFGQIIHFFHGSISETLKFESRSLVESEDFKFLVELEKSQRDSADLAIALSDWYPNRLDFPKTKLHLINPLQFLNRKTDSETFLLNNLNLPKIVSFSRLERRKGFDLAIEISRQVRSQISGINIVGPIHERRDLSSEFYSIAINRNIELELEDSRDSNAVYESINSNDILVICSRFDSFNLVALEALSAGKNVAISAECGVYHFLSSMYPEVYFIPISANSVGTSSKLISGALNDKFQNAAKLRVNQTVLMPIVVNDYYHILSKLKKDSSKASSPLITVKFSLLFTFFQFIHSGVKKSKRLDNIIKPTFKALINLGNFHKSIGKKLNDLLSNNLLINLLILIFPPKKIFRGTYANYRTFLEKPKDFLNLGNTSSGGEYLQLVYGLRIFRYLNYDPEKFDLQSLEDLSLKLNLKEIAEVTRQLASKDGLATLRYLRERELEFQKVNSEPIEVETRHEKKLNFAPTVTIIVSAYNAATKMAVFFDRLSCVPELLDGSAEVFIVDANSPTADLSAAIELSLKYGIHIRGIRTKQRISIQEAWNLGIQESDAEFLMFLGVDETIYSDSITQLIKKFALDPTLDWVMGNSVVASVNSRGDFLNDVMIYKRNGATDIHPYLETCYVSYVGGMYRRKLHSKFGYYDPSFKGAGDTEFKSRILPFLKVGYIEDTLGEFLNYPDDRTTASPIVEIEDLRAWYLFRSVGGLLYQAEIAGNDFLFHLLRATLGYRKSYCAHSSIDLTLGRDIYAVLELLGLLTSEDRKRKELLEKILSNQEALFFGRTNLFNIDKGIKLINLLRNLRQYLGKPDWSLRETLEQYRHDNIFEQHHWFW